MDNFDWEFLFLELGLGGGATCCFCGTGTFFLDISGIGLGTLFTLLLIYFFWLPGVAFELLLSERGVEIILRLDLTLFFCCEALSSYLDWDL